MNNNKLKKLKKGISDYLAVLEILNFDNSKKLDIENVKHFLKLINEIEEEEEGEN